MQHDLIEDFLKMGIKGIETCAPGMTDEEKSFYDRLCTERDLYKLGGTDHSGVLGGLSDQMPQKRIGPEMGYATEKDFMKLYQRKLG